MIGAPSEAHGGWRFLFVFFFGGGFVVEIQLPQKSGVPVWLDFQLRDVGLYAGWGVGCGVGLWSAA